MAPSTRGTKRAAVEASASNKESELTVGQLLTKTLKERGVSKTSYEAIVEAVNHPLAGDMTPEARRMLIAMIPECLCVPAQQRHQLQVTAVQMLTGIFETIMTNMQAEIDAETSKLATVETSKASLEEKISQAEVLLNEASDVSAAKKLACAEAAKTVMASKAALAEAERQQRVGDHELEEAKVYKIDLEKTAAENFCRLRDGEVEGDEAQQDFERLHKIAATLDLDDSLLTAMQSCMLKKPSDRGSFDMMVVSQLQEGFANKTAKITAQIENGAPAAAARQAAVNSAAQELTAAKQAQHVAADEMSTAFSAQELRKQDSDAAKAELENFMPEFEQASATHSTKTADLENFKAWNLANLEVLRERQEHAQPSKKAKKTADINEGTEVEELKTAAAELNVDQVAAEAVVAGA